MHVPDKTTNFQPSGGCILRKWLNTTQSHLDNSILQKSPTPSGWNRMEKG